MRIRTLLVCLLFVSGTTVWTFADEPGEYAPGQLQQHFQDLSSKYEFADDPKLIRVEKPLLIWSNPVRKQEQGSLFLWTKENRPAVLASYFTFVTKRVHLKHEVNSILDEPLTVSISGRPAWQPDGPGLKWQTLSEFRVPQSAARRLTLLRQISRRFRGEKTELDGERVSLRLLPQPLYRYSSAEHGIVDGALFAFVEGTDPEIYLFIEAVEEPTGTEHWKYSAARSHWVALQLALDGDVVWTATEEHDMRGKLENQRPWSQRPYFNFFPIEKLPPASELSSAER